MTDTRMPSEILLILGSHRSGSSALSRAVSLLGYSLPKTLIKDNASNRRGHWESQPVVRLNEEYLQAADLVWSDWTTAGLERVRVAKQAEFEQDIRSVVGAEYAADEPAVIKDPRLCRVIPRYRAAFDGRAPISSLLPVRNPLEVIASLERRNNISRQNAALLWLRYSLDAVSGSEGLPRAFVSYEQLLSDPVATINAAMGTIGSQERTHAEDVASELSDFLSPRLRNTSATNEELIHDDLTRGWISDTYAAMRLLISRPEDQKALATIARITEQFSASENLIAHITSSCDRELNEARRTSASLKATAELRGEQVSALRQARDELEARTERERQRLATDLDAATAHANALATSFANSQKELKDSRAAQAAHTRKLDRIREEARVQRSQIRHQMRTEQAQANAELDARIAALKAELVNHKAALDAMRGSTIWRATMPLRAGIDLLRRTIGRNQRPAATGASVPATQTDAASESEKPRPVDLHDAAAQIAEIAQIEASELFDADFYTDQYPEALDHPRGPAGHYATRGWKKGYDPSPMFTSRAYEHSHADLLGEDDCPLVDFMSRYPNGTSAMGAGKGNPRVVVFTAVSNNYDVLNNPICTIQGVDFVVFTDGDLPDGSVWQTRPFEYVDHDPVRTARFIKTHPHLYFDDYDYAIWMDANLTMRCDPRDLLPTGDGAAPISTWDHPLRDCVYEEAGICVAMGKDDLDSLNTYTARLESGRFPRDAGLFETSVVVTKMSDPRVKKFYETWWSHIEQGSRRDQLSLPMVSAETGVSVGHIAPERICMRTDPRFIYMRHAKRQETAEFKPGNAA